MNLTDCVDFILPATGFDDCNPVVNYSEIEEIYIASPNAAAFNNITDDSEWTARTSQTTSTTDAVRKLTVIGDMPAAANVAKELSNGRKKTIGKDYTVNYTVDDISDLTYAFFRELDAQPILKLFGFKTQAGIRYHYGNEGQIINHTSNLVLARGRDEVEVENGVITWRETTRPLRYVTSDAGSVTTFDTLLATATDATPDAVEGVTATATTTNANQKFEFNAITPQVGSPQSMAITVGGVNELDVDFTSDYLGAAFKYTTKAGVVKHSSFANGTRAL